MAEELCRRFVISQEGSKRQDRLWSEIGYVYKINRFELTLYTLRLSNAWTYKVSSVKCKVDAIGNVQSGICSFVPTD